MKTLLPLFFIGFLLIAASYPKDMYVDERTSTEVFFTTSEKMFPRHWYGNQINAEAHPLERSERQRIINILDKAFDKYPESVLKNDLDRVYALKSLKFYGVSYGGTNSKNTIYLADDESNPNYTNHFIEGVFHHEFSSILLRTYPEVLDEEIWNSINPSRFIYGNGGIIAILNGEASVLLDPKLFESGFLTKYSESAIEEDINVFAQNLFTGGHEFWEAVDTHKKIKKKASLLINFYHQIDPSFTESYFRKISN